MAVLLPGLRGDGAGEALRAGEERPGRSAVAGAAARERRVPGHLRCASGACRGPAGARAGAPDAAAPPGKTFSLPPAQRPGVLRRDALRNRLRDTLRGRPDLPHRGTATERGAPGGPAPPGRALRLGRALSRAAARPGLAPAARGGSPGGPGPRLRKGPAVRAETGVLQKAHR